jgi:hypothetical protein
LNAGPATSKNQLTSFGYDPAGNMTANSGATYTYDGENRLTFTAGVSYVYDGDGDRVIKCTGTLVPRTSDESDKRPDVDAFNRAMDEGKPGTTNLHIKAVFMGRFVCKPASPSPRDRRVIEIEQVDALEGTRTNPAGR